jgi:hypothetical protein
MRGYSTTSVGSATAREAGLARREPQRPVAAMTPSIMGGAIANKLGNFEAALARPNAADECGPEIADAAVFTGADQTPIGRQGLGRSRIPAIG